MPPARDDPNASGHLKGSNCLSSDLRHKGSVPGIHFGHSAGPRKGPLVIIVS